jgi:hypothetical protein
MHNLVLIFPDQEIEAALITLLDTLDQFLIGTQFIHPLPQAFYRTSRPGA